MFNHEAEQAESWMTKKETFLANEDLGNSLDAVEALIKKCADFDKALLAQVRSYDEDKIGKDMCTIVL